MTSTWAAGAGLVGLGGLALFGSAGSRRIRGRPHFCLIVQLAPILRGGGTDLTVLSDIRHNLSPVDVPFSLFNFVHFQPLSLSLRKTRGVDWIWKIGLAQRARFVQKVKSKEEKRC